MRGMAVRFVLGRAGTGKTQHCMAAVDEWTRERGVGAPVFLLVPSQATFTTERKLACDNGAPARLNVRVVSFESLARELGADQAGKELFVSARGRRIVLAQILRENAANLQYFHRTATQPHLAARLEAAMTEIQQEVLTFDQIETVLLSGAGMHNSEIAAKLHDLRLITNEYEKYLGQDRIDPLRRLQQLEARIHRSLLVKDALVLVDGFAGFTTIQIRLLIALAQHCERMDLFLLLDEDVSASPPQAVGEDMAVFARTRRTYARLLDAFRKQGIALENPLVLHDVHRFKSAALKAIEAQWESDHPVAAAASGNDLMIVEAPDLEQEVHYAARQIRQWQIEGVRLRDIGVLCRNLEPYYAAIGRTFSEHQIACFIDRRRPLASHPLVRYLNLVMQIVTQGWRQQAVVELLKTGLSGLDTADADFLENFALEHGIDKMAWISDEPWQLTQSHAAEDEAPDDERQANARAEVLRRRLTGSIRTFVTRLHQLRSMHDQVRALYDLLCCPEHNIRAMLGAWSKREQDTGNLERAQEHQQAWKQVMELLDDAVQLLGDVEAAGGHFAQTIEAGLEDLDLALTPPTLDQVMVGQVDRSRSPEFRKVIVLGLNEGEFPMLFAEDPIFSDAERKRLQENDVELAPGSAQQVLAENMLGYVAMTRASETLVLSRALATAQGTETVASRFIRRAQRIVTGVVASPADGGSVDAISSPVQAAVAIVQYLSRKKAALSGGEDRPYEELARWLLQQDERSAVAGPTHFALRGMTYENRAHLDPEEVAQLYPLPLVSSISRLEAYAACPFKHFAQYGLKLREREVAELSNLDLGNAFHFVLERMVRQIIAQRGSWSEIADADVEDLADQVARQLRSQLLLTSARNRYLLGHIKSTLRRVLRDQRIAQHAGEFSPLAAEIIFGDRPDAVLGALEITTPSGKLLKLQGKIDRVDWVEHELRAAVYDYKMRGKQLKLKEVLNGLTLQLLAYLLVLQQQGAALAGGKKLTPAGAFYIKLLRGMESAKVPADALADDEVEARPQGLFRADDFELFDSRTQAGEASKVLPVRRNADGSLARNSTAAMTEHELDTLLERVRELIAGLAEELLLGNVEVKPYRLNKSTPCEYCEFRSVCRVDPLINHYKVITRTREADLRKGLGGEEEGTP